MELEREYWKYDRRSRFKGTTSLRWELRMHLSLFPVGLGNFIDEGKDENVWLTSSIKFQHHSTIRVGPL